MTEREEGSPTPPENSREVIPPFRDPLFPYYAPMFHTVITSIMQSIHVQNGRRGMGGTRACKAGCVEKAGKADSMTMQHT